MESIFLLINRKKNEILMIYSSGIEKENLFFLNLSNYFFINN